MIIQADLYVLRFSRPTVSELGSEFAVKFNDVEAACTLKMLEGNGLMPGQWEKIQLEAQEIPNEYYGIVKFDAEFKLFLNKQIIGTGYVTRVSDF